MLVKMQKGKKSKRVKQIRFMSHLRIQKLCLLRGEKNKFKKGTKKKKAAR